MSMRVVRQQDLTPVQFVDATYIEQQVDEYRGNRLIEALPPIASLKRLQTLLPQRPPFNEGERELPPEVRFHVGLRLVDYYEALGRDIELAQKLDVLLRSSYIGRNPSAPDWHRKLQENYDKAQAARSGSLDEANLQPNSVFAHSLATCLIGESGLGKTRAVQRILSQYPQVIRHPEMGNYLQVTWLVVQCPHDGSVKQLCLHIFKALDDLFVKSFFAESFGNKSTTVPQRVREVVSLVQLLGIGLIVFDELQFIRPAGAAGIAEMFNFFTSILNQSAAPILFVGTSAALTIIRKDMSKARRSSGLGSATWSRFLPDDEEWDTLKRGVWKYQWTVKDSPYTKNISDVFDYYSQGIPDLVVKLYLLSQYRAIATEEEEVTADLMAQVAEDNFAVLRPLLEALRSNDPVAISQYDDLLYFDFDMMLEREQRTWGKPVSHEALQRIIEQDVQRQKEKMLSVLMARGLKANDAELAVHLMFSSRDEPAPRSSEKKARETMEEIKTRTSATKGGSENCEVRGAQVKDLLPEDDLRKIVLSGKSAGKSAGDALRDAGVIMSVEKVLSKA
jgi:hypothetical protein